MLTPPSQERIQRRALLMVSFVVAIIVPVVIIVAVAAPAMISFFVAIPVVVMFHSAAISFPVTGKVAFAVVARYNPTGSLVGWPSPIASMPPVMP